MYTPTVIFIQKLWLAWANIFNFMPFGNPYIAFIVLFFVIFGLIFLAFNIRWHHTSMKNFDKDEDRLKTWCKVMNIY